MDAEVGMSPKFQNDDPMSCSGKVFNQKKKEREKKKQLSSEGTARVALAFCLSFAVSPDQSHLGNT